MSLLPASAPVNLGQTVESFAGTTLQTGPGNFSKVQQQFAGPSDPFQPPTISPQLSPAADPLSPAPPAAAVDALQSKLAYDGDALSDLSARVATIKPAPAADSLQNRLDLLNAQFRVLGSELQKSATLNDPMQLLRLQNDIYQLDEELELVSRVVDQATSGVRSLLQTQV